MTLTVSLDKRPGTIVQTFTRRGHAELLMRTYRNAKLADTGEYIGVNFCCDTIDAADVYLSGCKQFIRFGTVFTLNDAILLRDHLTYLINRFGTVIGEKKKGM